MINQVPLTILTITLLILIIIPILKQKELLHSFSEAHYSFKRINRKLSFVFPIGLIIGGISISILTPVNSLLLISSVGFTYTGIKTWTSKFPLESTPHWISWVIGISALFLWVLLYIDWKPILIIPFLPFIFRKLKGIFIGELIILTLTLFSLWKY